LNHGIADNFCATEACFCSAGVSAGNRRARTEEAFMKRSIGAAILALALMLGGMSAIDPAAAAPSRAAAQKPQASDATDFSAHRYHRRYYRYGYRPYYRSVYRPYYGYGYRPHYRRYYYARPYYYRPYPYYYAPYPYYYAPAPFPLGFGLGFGFGPRWGW
jgi:hypothetical protein